MQYHTVTKYTIWYNDMEGKAEQLNVHVSEKQRYPEFPQDTGKLWSHCTGSVWGKIRGLYGRSVEKKDFWAQTGPKMQFFGPKFIQPACEAREPEGRARFAR